MVLGERDRADGSLKWSDEPIGGGADKDLFSDWKDEMRKIVDRWNTMKQIDII